jgi:hypothetical protein
MPEQPQAAPEILANLHQVAGLLRQAPHLGPEERRILAEVVDELAQALKAPQAPSPELMRLADNTTHLLQALHHRHDAGLVASARTRVEEALERAETRAPFVVGLVRRLVDMLAATGI